MFNESQIAILFETTRQNINLHIQNIIDECELDRESLCKESLHMGQIGQSYSVAYYNLDMILAIGYRVKGKRPLNLENGLNKKTIILAIIAVPLLWLIN